MSGTRPQIGTCDKVTCDKISVIRRDSRRKMLAQTLTNDNLLDTTAQTHIQPTMNSLGARRKARIIQTLDDDEVGAEGNNSPDGEWLLSWDFPNHTSSRCFHLLIRTKG